MYVNGVQYTVETVYRVYIRPRGNMPYFTYALFMLPAVRNTILSYQIVLVILFAKQIRVANTKPLDIYVSDHLMKST